MRNTPPSNYDPYRPRRDFKFFASIAAFFRSVPPSVIQGTLEKARNQDAETQQVIEKSRNQDREIKEALLNAGVKSYKC